MSTSQSCLRAVFTRTFAAVALINMLGLAGYYAVFVVSTRYLTDVFGAGPATAGLATGIIVIGCLVGRFFTGRIVHAAGYRRVLLAGVLLYLAGNALYFWADSIAQLFLVRFVSGLAVGIVGTVTGTIVAVVVPARYHGRGIAYFSMSTALSLCIGPFIGIALVDGIGFKGIFAASMALALVNVLLAPLVKVQAQRTTGHHKLALSDFIEPRLVPFSLMVGVVCLAWGNIQAFISPYANAFDLVAAASLFFLVYAAAILISRPLTGKIYDVHGPDVVIYPSLLLLAAGLFLLWGVQSSRSVLAAGALLGLGFGNFQSVAQASALSMVGKERYAQATSTFYIFFDLGIGAAPYLAGFLLPHMGYDSLYGLNALIVSACILWYALLRVKGRIRPRPSSGKPVDLKGPDRQ